MPLFDALIVGGGLHGCMVALALARAGMKTALLERGALCREASGVNAGTLTMQMTRVALIPYALKGHEMWASARDGLGDVGTVVCDGLSVAFTASEAEMLTLRAARRREAGHRSRSSPPPVHRQSSRASPTIRCWPRSRRGAGRSPPTRRTAG